MKSSDKIATVVYCERAANAVLIAANFVQRRYCLVD